MRTKESQAFTITELADMQSIINRYATGSTGLCHQHNAILSHSNAYCKDDDDGDVIAEIFPSRRVVTCYNKNHNSPSNAKQLNRKYGLI